MFFDHPGYPLPLSSTKTREREKEREGIAAADRKSGEPRMDLLE